MLIDEYMCCDDEKLTESGKDLKKLVRDFYSQWENIIKNQKHKNIIKDNKMKTRTNKPTKDEVKNFNDRYNEIVNVRKDIEKKLKILINEARAVDKLSSKLYKEANNDRKGMFYNDKNGILKCVNKDILNKIDEIEYLRWYSLNIR